MAAEATKFFLAMTYAWGTLYFGAYFGALALEQGLKPVLIPFYVGMAVISFIGISHILADKPTLGRTTN